MMDELREAMYLTTYRHPKTNRLHEAIYIHFPLIKKIGGLKMCWDGELIREYLVREKGAPKWVLEAPFLARRVWSWFHRAGIQRNPGLGEAE